MIVVDLGCAAHEGEQSVEVLLARYKPDMLFGFDPGGPDGYEVIDGCRCWFVREAAWLYDGDLHLGCGGPTHLYDTVVLNYDTENVWSEVRAVKCFDFSAWLKRQTEPTVVKMNVEGAEFSLIESALFTHADEHVVEWLVAWHDHVMPPEYAERRRSIEERVRCPLRSWGPADIAALA